jgi:hypothetical protein
MTALDWFRITLAVMGALTVLFSFAASLIGLKNRTHINEIKVNVNGRMDMALEDIRKLKEELEYQRKQPAENGNSDKNAV